MAMGKRRRRPKQTSMWVASQDLPRSAGTIQIKDVSFWRSINLGDVDGVFAIDFATFTKYFAGIGVVV
jgi:hypothetical protein